MQPEKFDAIIIGTGQGGAPLSKALAKEGWKVAIIEREAVGGSCVNWGCTPTKTLIASARAAYLCGRAKDFGVNTGKPEVDFKKVMARQAKIVKEFREGTEASLRKTENLELILGEGKFVAKKRIEVNGRILTAEKIFINTGTRAAVPKLPGLEEVSYLTNKSILKLKDLPQHLIILGGGYIGLEYGQAFRRLGSKVTIIEKSERLIAKEDVEVCEEVTAMLREEKIEVIFGQEIGCIAKGENKLEVNLDNRTIKGSHLLVAIGTQPNTDTLDLVTTGVETDERGFIKANDKLETATGGIYVIGDVKGGPAFTHISYDDFRILNENLLHKGKRTIKDRPLPYVMFTDPQLARVGITEDQAKKQGSKYRVAKLSMSQAARAIETGETRGFMKAVVGEDDQILGCTILGPEAGEIMAILQIAMMSKTPYTRIRDGVFAHPTLAESLNNLFMTLDS